MTDDPDMLEIETSSSDTTNTDHQVSHSNTEKPEPMPMPLNNVDLEYWYGKMYFNNAVAQVVFLSLSPQDSIPSADSQLRNLIQVFPYREAILLLQMTDAKIFCRYDTTGGGDPYTTFMCLAGSAVRQGTSYEKALLLETIERFARSNGTNVTELASRHSMEVDPPVRSDARSRDVFAGYDAASSEAFYTASLKEKADLSGIRLEYHIERHDLNSYRAELTFRGQKFVGVGKSKQQAKHRASKIACTNMDGQREHGL